MRWQEKCLELADQIWSSKDWNRLPYLADLLDENGFEGVAIINHFREMVDDDYHTTTKSCYHLEILIMRLENDTNRTRNYPPG